MQPDPVGSGCFHGMRMPDNLHSLILLMTRMGFSVMAVLQHAKEFCLPDKRPGMITV